MEIYRFGEKTGYINREQSIAMLHQFAACVRPHSCFSNVYRIVSGPVVHGPLDLDRLQVTYGFIHSQGTVYCAHAFFLGPDGIIDPTCVIEAAERETEYVIVLTLSLHEYFGYVVRARNTDLRNCREIGRIMNGCVQEAFQKGVCCIG